LHEGDETPAGKPTRLYKNSIFVCIMHLHYSNSNIKAVQDYHVIRGQRQRLFRNIM